MCIGLFFSSIPFNNQIDVLDRPGDTVLVQIPQIKWMESIDAHLLPSSCSGSIMAVNCDRIEQSDKPIEGLNASNGIYLIPSSAATIGFDVSRVNVADHKFDVWLFPSLDAANTAVEDNFGSYTCSDPPENTYCEAAYDQTQFLSLIFHVDYLQLRKTKLTVYCHNCLIMWTGPLYYYSTS